MKQIHAHDLWESECVKSAKSKPDSSRGRCKNKQILTSHMLQLVGTVLNLQCANMHHMTWVSYLILTTKIRIIRPFIFLLCWWSFVSTIPSGPCRSDTETLLVWLTCGCWGPCWQEAMGAMWWNPVRVTDTLCPISRIPVHQLWPRQRWSRPISSDWPGTATWHSNLMTPKSERGKYLQNRSSFYHFKWFYSPEVLLLRICLCGIVKFQIFFSSLRVILSISHRAPASDTCEGKISIMLQST